jgi:hypothetical protein
MMSECGHTICADCLNVAQEAANIKGSHDPNKKTEFNCCICRRAVSSDTFRPNFALGQMFDLKYVPKNGYSLCNEKKLYTKDMILDKTLPIKQQLEMVHKMLVTSRQNLYDLFLQYFINTLFDYIKKSPLVKAVKYSFDFEDFVKILGIDQDPRNTLPNDILTLLNETKNQIEETSTRFKIETIIQSKPLSFIAKEQFEFTMEIAFL